MKRRLSNAHRQGPPGIERCESPRANRDRKDWHPPGCGPLRWLRRQGHRSIEKGSGRKRLDGRVRKSARVLSFVDRTLRVRNSAHGSVPPTLLEKTLAFNVRKTTVQQVEVWQLTSSAGDVAEVCPALGFNCFRWSAGDWNVLYADPQFLAGTPPTRSGIPILFPFRCSWTIEARHAGADELSYPAAASERNHPGV